MVSSFLSPAYTMEHFSDWVATGIYYSFFEAFPLVYVGVYGFNIGELGVVFTCIVVGCVIGIVIYFWLVKPLRGFSALAGSVALAIMMLPIIVRSTEETLKLLPDSLKEAALALGMPFHRVIFKVIVPVGIGGILSGVMLSIARITGETAPLLFTAFGNPYLSVNMTKPMQSLPLLIYNYATSPYTDWLNLAWGASVVLLLWVLFLNIFTKIITRKWKVQL